MLKSQQYFQTFSQESFSGYVKALPTFDDPTQENIGESQSHAKSAEWIGTTTNYKGLKWCSIKPATHKKGCKVQGISPHSLKAFWVAQLSLCVFQMNYYLKEKGDAKSDMKSRYIDLLAHILF